MSRSLMLLMISTVVGFAVAGCTGDTATGAGAGVPTASPATLPAGISDGPPAPQAGMERKAGPPLGNVAAENFARLAQVAFDFHGDLADHNGCAVAAAFELGASKEELEDGLQAFIASGAAPELKSAELAVKALDALVDAESQLEVLCLASNSGSVALARKVVGSGVMLRGALGLPLK